MSSKSKIKLTKDERELANSLLHDALNIASSDDFIPSSKIKDEVQTILTGSHLTYKYILVNALLAKSTLSNINILCLQKKSLLPGAYDARSLCHKVLVPFERNFLNGALGRSNEPFLNKPARYTELSLGNAVRKGKDYELLTLLYNILPTLENKDEAFSALTDSIYYLLSIAEINEEIYNIEQTSKISPNIAESFIEDLLIKSFGGESLVLTVGTLITLLCNSSSNNDIVNTHTINQSGASSKEISDIDVYRNNKILYTIEAKDKTFSPEDVEHAFNKVAKAGCNRMMFITGPRATLSAGSYEELIEKASSIGVYLTFSSYSSFTKYILSLIDLSTLDDFFEIMMQIHKNSRLKVESREYLLELANEYDLI